MRQYWPFWHPGRGSSSRTKRSGEPSGGRHTSTFLTASITACGRFAWRLAMTRGALPPGCCDAVYMRTVFHHIDDPAAFAGQVWQAVRPGGRVAVIDFSPGSLWFHGHDHGVTPDAITAAFEHAGFLRSRPVERWGASLFLLLFERPT